MNRLLFVKHSVGEYPIIIGENIIADRAREFITGQQVLIITDEFVAPHYLSKIKTLCNCLQCDSLILPAGEKSKSLSTFEKIMDTCLLHHHHRDTTFIALGGGVVGDITGFSAACYQRGVRWIYFPTTLLAQVDASIGGKTGINHAHLKNMIGAFYPPHAVIIDIATLQSLPDREFRAGIAEIIKHALIQDAHFFAWLEKNMGALISRDSHTLLFAIQKSCEIKSRIVMQDEKEKNSRALLNLGHTFGHAIESALEFDRWLHGEAVAYGIILAARLSLQLALLDLKSYERIYAILNDHDFLKQLPDNVCTMELTKRMTFDKKVKAKQIHLVLLTEIGRAIVYNQISAEQIQKLWETSFSK